MIILEVPYQEKQEAKDLGARWNSDIKKWCVSQHIDVSSFSRWLPETQDFFNTIELEHQDKASSTGLDGPKHETISSVLRRAKQVLNDTFKHEFWLVADVAKLSRTASAAYVDLVEYDDNKKEVARIKAIIWNDDIIRSFYAESQEELRAGLSILTKVRLSIHERFGVQVTISLIDPTFTIGKAELKKREIRKELVKLDLVNKNKHFEEIEVFKKVAVISPDNAAALGDFKREADLLEKYGFVSFDYYTATFQGEKASDGICKAFIEIGSNLADQQYDCIAFIRGGGAEADLEWINDISIAKSVANSPVPVFVGVGHEVNRMIVDEIAFKSFDTPSKVVAFILVSVNANVTRISTLKDEIRANIDNHVSGLKYQVITLKKEIRGNLENEVNRLNHRVSILGEGIKNNIESKIDALKSKLELQKNRIRLISSGSKERQAASGQKNKMTLAIVFLIITIITILFITL